MEFFQKQVLIFIGAILLGLLIVFFGIGDIVHDKAIQLTMPVIPEGNRERISESIGYTAELILATVLMFSPLSISGGIWFLKLSYELTLGRTANVNVFLISPFLNKLMAVLCIILFIYSIYSQINWSLRFNVKTPEKDKKEKENEDTEEIAKAI